MTEVVIVGAGIIGLYTAFVLSRNIPSTKITIIAKHLPGDQSIEYTSPYAGGNFSQISGDDAAAIEYDRLSFIYLDQIFKDYGEKAGLKRLPTTELFDKPLAAAKLETLKKTVPDLEIISDKEYLKSKGASMGIRYTTYNFFSPFFLKFLFNLLQNQGVTFIRRNLKHISQAFDKDTKVVFNCTGVMAAKLGGVKDDKTYPIRGQVVVVRAPHIQENCSLFVDGQPPTYVIPRPNSGGRVILGGYYQEGNWSPETYAYETQSIIDRTTRLLPKLLERGPLEIIDERAGLRPGRKGGARIEKEIIDGKTVIHNYGAGGTGYQSGLGMALKAIALYDSQKARL